MMWEWSECSEESNFCKDIQAAPIYGLKLDFLLQMCYPTLTSSDSLSRYIHTHHGFSFRHLRFEGVSDMTENRIG